MGTLNVHQVLFIRPFYGSSAQHTTVRTTMMRTRQWMAMTKRGLQTHHTKVNNTKYDKRNVKHIFFHIFSGTLWQQASMHFAYTQQEDTTLLNGWRVRRNVCNDNVDDIQAKLYFFSFADIPFGVLCVVCVLHSWVEANKTRKNTHQHTQTGEKIYTKSQMFIFHQVLCVFPHPRETNEKFATEKKASKHPDLHSHNIYFKWK